jgi:quercetin dioxygenase-like cupin family protein
MADTTVKKVDTDYSPHGPDGQIYLAAGKNVAMRIWEEGPGNHDEPHTRPYETIGYVVQGRAELETEGQTVLLNEGDSWVVPAGARHAYHILEPFVAVEATSPPARVDGRDA